MELPPTVVSAVKSGKAVLFLGAGASFCASSLDGKEPLSGNSLRDKLCEHFLGNQHQQDSLSWVSELAISATDLSTVQDFIAEQFSGIEPAKFHLLLSSFKWRGLVTTNYDRLIERIYEKSNNAIQEIVPFISNNDRVDEKLRSSNHLALLKLHGCITRTHDPNLPFILSTDQYITHREGRSRIFQMFEDWCYENTVIFIGYGLQDQNLRSILLELSKNIENRPRYYLIKPRADQQEKDFWNTKRITVLEGTLESFLTILNQEIPEQQRKLIKLLTTDHPIQKKFILSETIAGSVKDLLEHDVEYIHENLNSEDGTPQRFYKGFDLSWYPILANLDVRRRLTETIIYDVIIKPEQDRVTKAELYVIKAEAGAGKTILLRRIAWEAGTQADALCLFVRKLGEPSFKALKELYRLTNERIFLFVDTTGDNISSIKKIIEDARHFDIPITVITAERINEWNMLCEELDNFVSDEYNLKYLSAKEIKELVKLLDKHNALGINLQNKTFEEQTKEFEQKAGRQLLVALHEATMGRPFEEIIIDEYKNIYPQQAQNLYLTVCLLNQFNVPVRAGLISRVHNINFSDFKNKLFQPLESVVKVETKKVTDDYMYTARHPEIAHMVFEGILIDDTDRYNEYIRVIKHLNISYDADRESFRKLLNARILKNNFSNDDDIQAIYKVATEIAKEESYLYQQMANYERIRVNGDYQKAQELLQKAQKLNPRDKSIIHSLAELAITRAKESTSILKCSKFRLEAKSFLDSLLSSSSDNRYAISTLIKLNIDELEDLLKQDESTDRDIEQAIRQVERHLEDAKSKWSEYFVETLEARFARILEDHERTLNALKSAFKINPRDPFIAISLSQIYWSKKDFIVAKNCINKALDNNQTDRTLNYRYAKILRQTNPFDIDSIAYHFRKSFLSGQNNYDAQFWYARYTYESCDIDKKEQAMDIFKQLRSASIKYEIKTEVRDYIKDENLNKKTFSGTVSRIEAMHGFVSIDGRGDDVFFHKKNVCNWDDLKTESRISFFVGFTYTGLVATEIKII
jgi:tetratricopeptide (TPR) repeat protein